MKLNPGPKNLFPVTIFRLILEFERLPGLQFEKVGLLDGYNTINKFDIICISEFYLGSSFSSHNENINIDCCKLARVHHSNNTIKSDI